MPSAANPWLLFALGSAFFAALTAIFGKLGVAEINPTLATLIRTAIILLMLLCVVSASHAWQPMGQMSRAGVTALVLSALATGASWLCYYKALSLGPASRVAPIDKLSVALVIFFSVLFLGEKLSWKLFAGSVLITAGAIVVAS